MGAEFCKYFDCFKFKRREDKKNDDYKLEAKYEYEKMPLLIKDIERNDEEEESIEEEKIEIKIENNLEWIIL